MRLSTFLFRWPLTVGSAFAGAALSTASLRRSVSVCAEVGGGGAYFREKFSVESEANETLRQTLREFDELSASGDAIEPQTEEQIKERLIFAWVLRHYYERAVFTANSALADEIRASILTPEFLAEIRERVSDSRESGQMEAWKRVRLDADAADASHCQHWAESEWFVLELAEWFNAEFMHWFNEKCPQCGHKLESERMAATSELSADESERGVVRVHLYQCANDECPVKEHRFERYRFADGLLFGARPPRGWCGEHSDAFGALLHANGCKWRFALDDTDHVWLEFQSRTGHWLSFEPSPDFLGLRRALRCDAHAHFGKRHSRYVLAVGHESVADVTANYQTDATALAERRSADPKGAKWLQQFLDDECAIRHWPTFTL